MKKKRITNISNMNDSNQKFIDFELYDDNNNNNNKTHTHTQRKTGYVYLWLLVSFWVDSLA